MAERTVVIGSRVGLHARPAALFAQAAAVARARVTISRPGGKPVDAASILMVLTLGVACGESVMISAEGDGADAALDALAVLLARDLDAEP
ncbi:MAG: HPr family phosphocarrier protein [Micromonosporaceae bacterium]|nr:HPr family phosphocarrier protein [Micromonosporaceae bacterium]